MRFPRDLSELAPLTDLRPTDTGFVADTWATEHGAIMGAHELLQQVLAAERAEPGKRVLSLQTAFLDGGRSGEPLHVTVERDRRGRSFAGVTVTMTQGPRVTSRAVVLLSADEPDYLRHQSPPPRPVSPAAWTATEPGPWPGRAWRAPGRGGGELALRLGLESPPADATVARALTAMATEHLVMQALVGLAEGPWEFRQGSGNVLTQTVTLLEPAGDADALVISAVPAYAGGGRAHGNGTVTDDDGRLLATFQTTGVLRAPPVRGN